MAPGSNKINVSSMDRTLGTVKEAATVEDKSMGATMQGETSQERPTRDRGSSNKHSPYMKALGGGSSADRMRKMEADQYEERVDDMHTRIGKYDKLLFGA